MSSLKEKLDILDEQRQSNSNIQFRYRRAKVNRKGKYKDLKHGSSDHGAA